MKISVGLQLEIWRLRWFWEGGGGGRVLGWMFFMFMMNMKNTIEGGGSGVVYGGRKGGRETNYRFMMYIVRPFH